jgi:hypothetical protein
MLLRILPLLAGILPLIAMFGAFWLGVHNDVVPACIPFVDGCTSISATGRKPPGSFLFRAIMLPQAPLLLAVWYVTVLWLRSLHPDLRQSTARAILLSGIIGALALIVYVTFLGTKEPIYEFMRRTGIYFGFLGIALAQLFTAIAVVRVSKLIGRDRLLKLARLMLGLCLAMFALGIINVVFKIIFADADAMENRIEWIASVLMQCYFFVMYFAWRETGISAAVSVRND